MWGQAGAQASSPVCHHASSPAQSRVLALRRVLALQPSLLGGGAGPSEGGTLAITHPSQPPVPLEPGDSSPAVVPPVPPLSMLGGLLAPTAGWHAVHRVLGGGRGVSRANASAALAPAGLKRPREVLGCHLSSQIVPPGNSLPRDTGFGKSNPCARRACTVLRCTRTRWESLAGPSRWQSHVPGPLPATTGLQPCGRQLPRHPWAPLRWGRACGPVHPAMRLPQLLQSWPCLELSAIFSPPPCYFACLAGVYNWPGQPHLLSAFSPFPSLSFPPFFSPPLCSFPPRPLLCARLPSHPRRTPMLAVPSSARCPLGFAPPAAEARRAASRRHGAH